jgi:Polyketide cyclase / dehydrase and lipid transport
VARTVVAETELALEPEAAAELWTDPDRWATFVEGFAQVVERSEAWPDEGGKLVWESKPEGRGRVTERIVKRAPGVVRSEVYEQRLAGVQTARFGDGRFRLELEYELTGSPLVKGVTDALFIRRALRDMLRRTVRRFAVEAEEEAGLR